MGQAAHHFAEVGRRISGGRRWRVPGRTWGATFSAGRLVRRSRCGSGRVVWRGRPRSAGENYSRQGMDKMRAAQTGRVYCVRDEFLNTPAPTLVCGLKALAAAIHPELFLQPDGLRCIAACAKSTNEAQPL